MPLLPEDLQLPPKMEAGIVEDPSNRRAVVTTNIHFTSMIHVSTLLLDRAQSPIGVGSTIGREASKMLTNAMMEYIREYDPELIYSEAMTLLTRDDWAYPPSQMGAHVF